MSFKQGNEHDQICVLHDFCGFSVGENQQVGKTLHCISLLFCPSILLVPVLETLLPTPRPWTPFRWVPKSFPFMKCSLGIFLMLLNSSATHPVFFSFRHQQITKFKYAQRIQFSLITLDLFRSLLLHIKVQMRTLPVKMFNN